MPAAVVHSGLWIMGVWLVQHLTPCVSDATRRRPTAVACLVHGWLATVLLTLMRDASNRHRVLSCDQCMRAVCGEASVIDNDMCFAGAYRRRRRPVCLAVPSRFLVSSSALVQHLF